MPKLEARDADELLYLARMLTQGRFGESSDKPKPDVFVRFSAVNCDVRRVGPFSVVEISLGTSTVGAALVMNGWRGPKKEQIAALTGTWEWRLEEDVEGTCPLYDSFEIGSPLTTE